MEYRRAKISGGTYFFTIVTFERKEILCQKENVGLLRAAFETVKKNYPFAMEAIVILPDHIHCLIKLPEGCTDYPLRLRLIKTHFSRRYLANDVANTPSRIQKCEKAVWQRRYWEHTIRDDLDYRRHVEYIHYNPVKHGLVDAPKDWKYSSFHSFVRKGIYDQGWGWGDIVLFDDGVGAE